MANRSGAGAGSLAAKRINYLSDQSLLVRAAFEELEVAVIHLDPSDPDGLAVPPLQEDSSGECIVDKTCSQKGNSPLRDSSALKRRNRLFFREGDLAHMIAS